jgi:hypothetical protein
MTWAPTDLSQLPLHYPQRATTTNLYLNFDGGSINDSQTGGGTWNVAAYQPPAGVDRVQAIQDIIYRTSEIFSPFNVRVRIMRGAGNFSKTNGDTTIFIGDNADNQSGGYNVTDSRTPTASNDWPGDKKGLDHLPNGDAYDLAFVDPVAYDPQSNSNITTLSAQDISRDVAHEAGHTFGLAHVLSSPDKDLMSYDTSNNLAFLDTSYDITDQNYNGTTTTNTGEFPKVNAVDPSGRKYPLEIHHQNSFAYLRYEMGNKNIYVDPYYHSVADKTTVSPDYYAVLGDPTVITPASHPSSVLSNFGEYDVYTLNNPANRFSYLMPSSATKISLAIGAPAFDPQIMLYNSDGTQLLAAVHGSSLQYTLAWNTSYKLVISGYLGDTAGAYTVNMSSVPLSATLANYAVATATTPPPVTTTVTATAFSKTLLSKSASLLA